MAAAAAAARTQRASNREEIQAVINKGMEIRALHSVLLHGSSGSPSATRLPAAAAAEARPSVRFSPEDYPVFMPSYGAKPSPGHRYIRSDSRGAREDCGADSFVGRSKGEELVLYEGKTTNKLPSFDGEHPCSVDDQLSLSRKSSIFSGAEALRIGRSRTHSGDFGGSSATCNRCQPATISRKSGGRDHRSPKSAIHESASTVGHSHPKRKVPIFSWLFPRGKKKSKPEMSPSAIEPDNVSQLLKDWGVLSLESLKQELVEANEIKDTALAEVTDMKSSLGNLKKKLASLESYCEELKGALKQAAHSKGARTTDRPSLSKRTKSEGDPKDNPTMPVSNEVMVEGFLQMVSEARLSVKQFCRTLINEAEENSSDGLAEDLNSLLRSHQVAFASGSRNSKTVLYQLESLVNQSLYQDFENCIFQNGGCPKFLDPLRARQDNFTTFVALRNLSWSEASTEGSKFYNEDFSRFCGQKMSGIALMLGRSGRPWPENLLRSFFISAKCIWLLHLLAFSFDPALTILRVDENRSFDSLYMEDVLHEKQKAPGHVKAMVTPGFYVFDRVIRCRVLCKYRSVS